MASAEPPPGGLVDGLLLQNSESPGVLLSLPVTSSSTSASPSCTTSGPKFTATSGTSSRQKLYLLDQFPLAELPISKLPKTKLVMRYFFNLLLQKEDLSKHSNSLTLATKSAISKAARETAIATKSIWRHHFGIRLIDGQDTESGKVDTTKIMIIGEKAITEKIANIFSEWKNCERLSRRPDRAAILVGKEDSLRAKLENPFNILKVKGEDILCAEGGITDWQEELQHLRNQLTPEQPGTTGSCMRS